MAPTDDTENQFSQIPLLAAIGHVCLQWSILEMTILAVLNVIEELEPEEGFILFGGQDILPRFSLAIRLLDHLNAPQEIPEELRAIRELLQKRNGIKDRRNQAVHGAHADADQLDAVQLTMVRWAGARRTQTVTLEQLIDLTEEIHSAQRRTYGVFQKIGQWQSLRA